MGILGLSGVDIQSTRINVGSIGGNVGKGVEEALQQGARGGVGSEQVAFRWERDEDVAIHTAANLLHATIDC